MKKTEYGYMTVYMSLTLGVLIMVMMTMLQGIRIQTIRYGTEYAMDLGMKSIFAEYHRQMLKRYGLLYIDSSYGGESASDDYTKGHLLNYMNSNFKKKSGKDILGIHADNARIGNVSYASDDNGIITRYQIDRYMKAKTGLGMIDSEEEEDMSDLIGDYDDYMGQWDVAETDIDMIIEGINENLEEGEEYVSISNPADSVEVLNRSNALFYAVGDINKLDSNTVVLSDYISHRGCGNGAGLWESQNAPDGIVERQLYNAYIFDKCGYYDNLHDESALSYQIEYLLQGEDDDIKNMEGVAEDIFKIRYVTNITYLFTDSAKQAEAEELALIATSIIGNPELTELVKLTILFAWAYAESAKDLRILYDGNQLGIVKDASSWNTPLIQLTSFREHLNEYSAPAGSLSYKKFLYTFINVQNIDKTTERLMDLMEMDMRITPGNSSFKIDNQIYQLYAEVNVSSKYGYGCQINRKYSYE